jgi:hypothetical protein
MLLEKEELHCRWFHHEEAVDTKVKGGQDLSPRGAQHARTVGRCSVWTHEDYCKIEGADQR